MLKEAIEMMVQMIIPVYGDIKIHRYFTKDRIDAQKKFQEVEAKGNQLDEREEKFKRELSDLLKKYHIKEELGSPISFPSEYAAGERSDLGSIILRSTIIPEIETYFGKYTILFSAFYQFSP